MSEKKELTSGDVVKLEQGQSIKGEFMSCDVSTQYPDSFALKLKVEGKSKVVFVNNIVKDLLTEHKIQEGSNIELEFVGMKSNKAGTQEYKEYKLFQL